ncbi:hypothetical protein K7X08_025329 [Anisodus acutangulus]|uniref:Annexin n=1 Tax=Anisodus acutangulus TaxID=402998 RepID=A0A9Q1R7X0_9SOLA|nr:hypothetical protein K7X08_025329 [Anisodus acutangulus]
MVKMFAGWGTNEELIIQILAHRNAAQRKLIRESYATAYSEDLLKDLDAELTSDFQRVVLLWTLSPAERDAYLANEATKRLTASNWVIMEIACTRSSDELFKARQAYHAKYKRLLEEDVAYHTTGDFPIECLKTPERYFEKVLRLGIKKLGTDEWDLTRVVTTRAEVDMERIKEEYHKRNGVTLDRAIAGDTSGDYERMLLALIRHVDA